MGYARIMPNDINMRDMLRFLFYFRRFVPRSCLIQTSTDTPHMISNTIPNIINDKYNPNRSDPDICSPPCIVMPPRARG